MRIGLDIPLSIEEIATSLGTPLPQELSKPTVTHIALNSRSAEKGDLFIALNGERFHGSDFAADALRKGAIVISDIECEGCFCVKDGKAALGKIASLYKSKLKNLGHTVMITGSVGKSTTKNFCKRLLSSTLKVHATDGNLNNDVGLPITLLRARRDCECLILEAGMNSRGEISYLSKLAKPSIGIITNIGRAHVGRLGNIEEVATAKSEIKDGLCGELILPHGEPLLRIEGSRTVSFGKAEGNYSIIPSKIDSSGSDFSFYRNGLRLFDGRLKIPGAHFLKSLAFAISVADILKISEEDIFRGIDAIGSNDVPARLVDFRDFSVFDDSYNASPESVLSALDTLSLFEGRPKSALIGDMLELGDEAKAAHAEVGRKAAELGLRRLYLMGEFCDCTEEGALRGGMSPSAIFKNYDLYSPEVTARQILSNHEQAEIVLFKASHAVDLTRVLEYLKIMEG